AAALAVEPELLVRKEEAEQPQLVARLAENGPEAPSTPRDAVLPIELIGGAPLLATAVGSRAGGHRGGARGGQRRAAPKELGRAPLMAIAVDSSAGDDRGGDQVWLRRVEPKEFGRLLNRDVLAPRSAGRFAFGRMIDRDGKRIVLLPPGTGQRQVVVENPEWL